MNLYSESNGTAVASRQRPACRLGVDADLGGEHHQGRLGRVADRSSSSAATVASLHSVEAEREPA